MTNLDKLVAGVEAAHPSHQVWYVPRAVGAKLVWHARRRDGSGDILPADSSEELRELLEGEAETGV
jgi:hypothetical protein